MKRDRLQTFFSAVCLMILIASLPACGARYINAKVREAGTGPFTDFYADRQKDLDIYPAGATSGPVTVNLLAESLNVTALTYPVPSEIRILTTGPHDLGIKTSSGYAEIRFGQMNDPDPLVFTTDAPGTFFEFQLFDIYRESGQRVASGAFSAIARNKNDNTDTRRIEIRDGSFVTKIKN